jgi:hypothetical protein
MQAAIQRVLPSVTAPIGWGITLDRAPGCVHAARFTGMAAHTLS